MNDPAKPVRYEICVHGRLSGTLLSAFPSLRAEARGTDTVLAGELPDQAALFGVLTQIEALGLELLGLCRKPATRSRSV